MASVPTRCHTAGHAREFTITRALAVVLALCGPGSTAFACEDRVALVAQLEVAAVEGRLADAAGVRRRLEGALACGLPVVPELLARLWIADAMIAAAETDEEAARDALAAAIRVAPSASAEAFGAPMQRRLAEARQLPPPGTGTLRLEPFPDHAVAMLDGQPLAALPVDVAAGLHVAQAGWTADDMAFAREVYVPAGTEMVLAVLLPVPVPLPVPPVPVSAAPQPAPAGPTTEPASRSRRPTALLILAAVTAAGAGVTAGLADAQDAAMIRATTEDEVLRAYGRQVRYGATSYTLMGVTSVSLGLFLVYEVVNR